MRKKRCRKLKIFFRIAMIFNWQIQDNSTKLVYFRLPRKEMRHQVLIHSYLRKNLKVLKWSVAPNKWEYEMSLANCTEQKKSTLKPNDGWKGILNNAIKWNCFTHPSTFPLVSISSDIFLGKFSEVLKTWGKKLFSLAVFYFR